MSYRGRCTLGFKPSSGCPVLSLPPCWACGCQCATSYSRTITVPFATTKVAVFSPLALLFTAIRHERCRMLPHPPAGIAGVRGSMAIRLRPCMVIRNSHLLEYNIAMVGGAQSHQRDCCTERSLAGHRYPRSQLLSYHIFAASTFLHTYTVV